MLYHMKQMLSGGSWQPTKPAIAIMHQPRIYLAYLALCLVALDAAALSPADIPLIARNAQRGDDASQVLLATAYLDGDGGLAKDPVLAAHWYELAALQGNSFAQERIADLYLAGTGVRQDPRLAFDWMLKSAERGNLRAQVKLAQMYQQGTGTASDPEKARFWLERAAVEGSAEAQYLLGKMDHAAAADRSGRLQARTWLERAAKQGYDKAIMLLNEIESLGYGAEESWHRRLPDIRKLAEDGDPEAEYQLAIRYEHGTGGVAQNIGEAVRWYERAAEHGNRMAMLALSHLYASGNGVAVDAAKAKAWAERADAAKPRAPGR
jgi:TPR repeat protein